MLIKEVEKMINEKHEEYQRNISLWKTSYMAWQGGEDFKKQFLWPFEREDEEDFNDRLNRASYENLFSDIIYRRQSLIFSRKIYRNKNKALRTIDNNFDGQESSREEFIRRCFRLSQIFGFLPVLVTINNSGQPQLVPVLPFSLINWQRDEQGKLEWVIIKAKPQINQKGDRIDFYHLYERDKVSVFRLASRKKSFFTLKSSVLELEEELPNTLGQVPLTILYDINDDENELAGVSSLRDSLELIIKLYNLNSWYDQLLYKTNYSTLAATPFHGSSDDMEIVVGAGDVLWVPEGCQMPQWIAPDTGPSEVFEKRLSHLRSRIYELAELDVGIKESSKNIISGEAFSYQRKPVEEMALRLAKQLEEFEKKLEKMLVALISTEKNYQSQVKYPESYSQKSLNESIREIEMLDGIASIPSEAKTWMVGRILTSGRIAQLSEDEQNELKQLLSQKTTFPEGGVNNDATEP